MDYLQPERKYAIERSADTHLYITMPDELFDELKAMPYWNTCVRDTPQFFASILPTYNADAVIAWLDTWLDEKTNDIPLSDIWRLDE